MTPFNIRGRHFAFSGLTSVAAAGSMIAEARIEFLVFPHLQPELYLDRYEKIIKTYLSPVLPEGRDFFFKNQSSVKNFRDLHHIADGSFSDETGGADRFEKLLRVQGVVQLIYLMEITLCNREMSFSNSHWCKEELQGFADSMILRELDHSRYLGADKLYEEFMEYARARTEHAKRPLEYTLFHLEYSLKRALKASVKRIMDKACPGMRNKFGRVEKHFDLIPDAWVDESIEYLKQRIEKLNECTEK